MKNLEIRTIEKYGIKIILKIDFDRGRVSLVERNHDGAYVNKRWLFADRELEYMGGWMQILDAMKYAVDEATKELEQLQIQRDDETTQVMIRLDLAKEALHKKPRKRKV